MMKNLKKKKGFTLIELIIVIAILGIIAAIAIPRFSGLQEDSKVKADISTAKTIADITAVLVAKGTGDGGLGKDVTAFDASTETKITSQLQTTPKVQAVDPAVNEFYVTIAAGTITVGVGPDATHILKIFPEVETGKVYPKDIPTVTP